MVLTRKHRTTVTAATPKDDGTPSTEARKTSLIKKSRSPDKITTKQKDTKGKASTIKSQKILKSASVTKKSGEKSKIPVPLSKSSTYKQVTVQKHKVKATPKKVQEVQTPSTKTDVKYVMGPKELNNDVAYRVSQMKKVDAENIKRIKNQYFSSVLADIRKTDLETTLRKFASSSEKNAPEQKRKKRKSLKKKSPPKVLRVSPRIISETENEYGGSLNNSPSMTTHYLEADSQTSQIPVNVHKRPYKAPKLKRSPRSPRAKLTTTTTTTEGKDAKTTQLSQHKKKSKTHTLKLNRVQSSDSVPNLPIREIKHNDSFVLSAKKLENASMKRAAQAGLKKNIPEHLKLKTKRPMSAHQGGGNQKPPTTEPKTDTTKPEQLKSCLKKTWDENDFTAVNSKYEMNFGLVPLIVN